MTTKTKKVKFTEAEREILGSVAYGVFSEIAPDLLAGIAEDKGKSIDAVTVSRPLAIEVALDAGRFEEAIAQDRARAARAGREPKVTDDLLARIKAADYKTLIAAVKPGFPYTRYGM